MIILITGASHTGKTVLAQNFLEQYHFPYLSIDLLKMGLIRSGQTSLTAQDDEELVRYLWPIVKEMIQTALENEQNLIVEGSYIPFDWQEDFTTSDLEAIRYYCLVMSEDYIRKHFEDIKSFANLIEQRLDDSYFTMEHAIAENKKFLEKGLEYQLPYILIDEDYEGDLKVGL